MCPHRRAVDASALRVPLPRDLVLAPLEEEIAARARIHGLVDLSDVPEPIDGFGEQLLRAVEALLLLFELREVGERERTDPAVPEGIGERHRLAVEAARRRRVAEVEREPAHAGGVHRRHARELDLLHLALHERVTLPRLLGTTGVTQLDALVRASEEHEVQGKIRRGRELGEVRERVVVLTALRPHGLAREEDQRPLDDIAVAERVDCPGELLETRLRGHCVKLGSGHREVRAQTWIEGCAACVVDGRHHVVLLAANEVADARVGNTLQHLAPDVESACQVGKRAGVLVARTLRFSGLERLQLLARKVSNADVKREPALVVGVEQRFVAKRAEERDGVGSDDVLRHVERKPSCEDGAA